MEHLKLRKQKNGRVAIHGPPQGSMKGQVSQSRNCASCHKLPVEYKFFHFLNLNANISMPVFRSSSLIMCHYHGFPSEKLFMQAH
jgi:hypothetical protein